MAKRGRRNYRYRYTGRRSRKFKLKGNTLYSILAMLTWGAAVLIFLSWGRQGELLTRAYIILYQMLGPGIYLMPFNLVAIGFLLIGSKTFLSKPNLSIGLLMMTSAIMAIGQMGEVGGQFWLHLAKAITGAGALLIYFLLLTMGLIIFLNTSLDKFVNGVAVVLGTILNIFRSEKLVKSKKEERRQLFDFDKTPIKVKGGQMDVKQPVVPPPVPAPKVAVKPATSLSDELVVNQPKTPTNHVWEYPPLSLLDAAPRTKADRGDMKKNAFLIESTLDSFGIAAKVVEVNYGPAVTQYALQIALGTKVSKITALANDLALALAAPTGQIRIEAPIPGRNLVGIEIPNRTLEFVTLKTMLQSDVMRNNKNKLAVSLGLDVSGNPVITQINKMPHVLIAGTTGSGKSVLINSWICSLLFRATPDEVKLILVDPKRVELIGYNDIPHLLVPVIVEPDKILSALKWATQEMDRRYKQFAEVGVRNIDGYNELSGFQALPYIVIFIDELADLMAFAPVEVEDAICRIAQLARATGIHLVISTQRPSVDVLTGLIKANIPCRIAFNVSSNVDSRVILDLPGAEKLLGRGDMLYIPPDQAKPSRIQGTFVSDAEVKKLVAFLKEKNAPVKYTQEVTSLPASAWKKGTAGAGSGQDELFEQAVRTVCQYDRASASLLQRRLSIGYARAARILDQLEQAGIVGMGEGSKPRDVLVKNPDEYFAQVQESSAQPQS